MPFEHDFTFVHDETDDLFVHVLTLDCVSAAAHTELHCVGANIATNTKFSTIAMHHGQARVSCDTNATTNTKSSTMATHRSVAGMPRNIADQKHTQGYILHGAHYFEDRVADHTNVSRKNCVRWALLSVLDLI